MKTLIILEKPLEQEEMLKVMEQASARHLHMISNNRGEIRLCSIIPQGWKAHRVTVKPSKQVAA